tara:strand:- start:905 stop:2002 length:1098 start_codon:yes stop_codon:yes gene_type:complete
MRYCNKCVTPDTRPSVTLDNEGVCNLCRAAEDKHDGIDWHAKAQELEEILSQYRGSNGNGYDCLIPASGGKDSTWQLLTIMKLGLRPLIYHFSTCPMTDQGKKNFDNFVDLGVDVVHHIPNPKVYSHLMRQAFVETGNHCLFCNFGIFAGAVQVAINYGIKLIVFGEGGSEFGVKDGKYYDSGDLSFLDQGKKPQDFIDAEVSEADLTIFNYPTRDEIQTAGVRQICLGNYVKYDLPSQLKLVKDNGFQPHDGPWLGTYVNHSDLDCPFFGIHGYLMNLKFGYGRANADASKEVRNGTISREKAVELANQYDGGIHSPLEKQYLRQFLDYTDLSEQEFHAAAEKFRNNDIWERSGNCWSKKAELK